MRTRSVGGEAAVSKVSTRTQPSPGNIRGGLTTIEEKSLGAIQKGGRATVAAVLRHASLASSARYARVGPERLRAVIGADLLPFARKLIYVPETARLERLLHTRNFLAWALLLVPFIAAAHDFWVWPKTFRPAPDTRVELEAGVGEQFARRLTALSEGRFGITRGMPRIETDIDATEVILSLAPETNGEVAVKAWAALSEATGRDHRHLADTREDEKLRFRDLQAQPRKIISSPTWSGIESEHVSYNAGYTNVHELIPWRTVSGRQQFYQDHPWMRAFGESLLTYRPPINTKTITGFAMPEDNGNPTKALNWITPHQKWGIHSTYSDNLLMLTLNRGGPVVWMSETDAQEIGIEDNDWIELFNANGAITARAIVSQRVKAGMVMMYHAQERQVNVPGSEITKTRGGMHNSVTRVCPKPTHMIGGYAQLSYSFNYYGTVGSNRDEFVLIRKMKNVDWLDGEGNDSVQETVK